MHSTFAIGDKVFSLNPFMPMDILKEANNLEMRIQCISSKLPSIDTRDVSGKIKQIVINAETELMYEDQMTVIKTASVSLQNLLKTEWIFNCSRLLNIVEKTKARISSIHSDLKCEFSDQIHFENHEFSLNQLISDTEKGVHELNEKDKKEYINEMIAQVQHTLLTIEVDISIRSLSDIKHKISQRIEYGCDQFDLQFEPEHKQLKEILSNALKAINATQDIKEKFTLAKVARNLMEDVDIEVEKKIAMKEIDKKKEEIKIIIDKLDDEPSHIAFKNESDTADLIYNDCKDIFDGIHKPRSPGGFSPVSQLFVAASGALTSLERDKSNVYLKYGMRCIEKRIQFAALILEHDGVSLGKKEKFKHFASVLLKSAKEEITYGTILINAEEKNLRENTVPPIISLEIVEKIVSQYNQKITFFLKAKDSDPVI